LAVPDDLGETKIGNLDCANTTCSLSSDELALISLVFILGALRLRIPRWDEWDWVEE
jgi:hypothetical protein